MTPRDLANLGVEEIQRRACAGELDASHIWMAARGASRYLSAIAAGGIADDGTQAARLSACQACPSCTTTPSGYTTPNRVVQAKHWCGEPLRDRSGEPDPTCGCIVALTVDGIAIPAGKACVQREACPQARW